MALRFLVRRCAAVQSVSLRSKLYSPTLQICQKKVSVKELKTGQRLKVGNDIGSKIEGGHSGLELGIEGATCYIE